MIISSVPVNVIHLIELFRVIVTHEQHGYKPMHEITACLAASVMERHQLIAFVVCSL